MSRPHAHRSVMNSRTEAPDSLDFFPTPPWATRAFLPTLQALDPAFREAVVWEPACGEGHMASVLSEASAQVIASDVFDYSAGDADFIFGAFPGWVGTIDFLGLAERETAPVADWIISNPPFNEALKFVRLALGRARRGVAMLVRVSWLSTIERYVTLFQPHPPRLIIQYVERVPMFKGRWDPAGSTATDYCWVVWTVGNLAVDTPTQFSWIAPGQRDALTTREDIERFAQIAPAPLLDVISPALDEFEL